jgi:hypothetical protein
LCFSRFLLNKIRIILTFLFKFHSQVVEQIKPTKPAIKSHQAFEATAAKNCPSDANDDIPTARSHRQVYTLAIGTSENIQLCLTKHKLLFSNSFYFMKTLDELVEYKLNYLKFVATSFNGHIV